MEDAVDIYRCTPRQTRKFAIRVLEAGLVPFVQSSPGMGKSSIFRGIANDFVLQLNDHRLSTSAPEDLSGLPSFVNGKATFSPFDIFPVEGTPIPDGYNGWLLFLDEANSAAKSVQAAAYKLVLDKMVGQHRLHEQVAIAMAGNLATDRAITNPLSTAMQSRVVHIEMQIDFNEWLEDVAWPEKYDERIIAFLHFQDKLMDFDPSHNEKTFCCPRTWEFMNKLVTGNEVVDDDAALYAGVITSGVAVSFVQFCQVYKKLVTLKDVLRDPAGAPVPDDAASRWAIISHLIERVEDKNFGDLSTYANRFPLEFRILFYRSVMARQPGLRQNPIFAKAMGELSHHLHGN